MINSIKRIHLRSYMHLQTDCITYGDWCMTFAIYAVWILGRVARDSRVWSTNPVTDYLRRLVHDLRLLFCLDPREDHTWWPCLMHWSSYRLLTETGAWPSPSMPSGSSGGSHVMAVSEALIRLQMFFPTNTFTSLIIGLILRNFPCEESRKCVRGSS